MKALQSGKANLDKLPHDGTQPYEVECFSMKIASW